MFLKIMPAPASAASWEFYSDSFFFQFCSFFFFLFFSLLLFTKYHRVWTVLLLSIQDEVDIADF